MTNKELQEILSKYPDDATMECLEGYAQFYETATRWVYMDDDCVYFNDRKNLIQIGAE